MPEASAPTAEAAALDGADVHRLFSAAADWLAANADAINAINVFPVPDGDTGLNMSLTLVAAVTAAGPVAAEGSTASEVAAAMSRGALMGARGNSGVILSQIIRGFSAGLSGAGAASPAVLARAFRAARDAAYGAVPEPVEGTILTVIEAVATAAEGYVATTEPTCPGLITATTEAAREAVRRTPELLPVLAEAGVVDAGGQGLLTILEGVRREITGEGEAAPAPSPATRAQVMAAAAHEEGDIFGYCTEVLLSGRALDRDAALARMSDLGRSVLVVGDQDLLRVHVHTEDPGAVLSWGTSLGVLLRVKVDNMDEQHRAWLAGQRDAVLTGSEAGTGWRLVAVAPGDGMAEVLRGLGVSVTVAGGQTNNPSAEEILSGVATAGGDGVFVLPNNKNVVLTAGQAASLTPATVRVIPTRTFPQGVAAALAFSPEATAEENERAMTSAAASVQTIEVTRAVRPAHVKGVDVAQGQFIAIVDGDLALAGESAEEVALAALDALANDEATVVTVYWGEGTLEPLARDLAERIRGGFGVEVEVVRGGQPLYPYIISVE